MSCWKTINLTKDIGLYRIILISLLTMILSFILTYLPINLLYSKVHLKDGHFLMFVLLLISMPPFHKLLHMIPLVLCGCRFSARIKLFYLFPTIQLKACQGMKKNEMIASLLTPFVTFSILFVLGSIYLPTYMHYFSIAMAFHIGLCVPDFLLLKHLLFAPKLCFIEEFEDGYEVLVQNK